MLISSLPSTDQREDSGIPQATLRLLTDSVPLLNAAAARKVFGYKGNIVAKSTEFTRSDELWIKAPLYHPPHQMVHITAAVIDGVNLKGGKGSIHGAFAGVLFLAMVNNGLNLRNVDPLWVNAVRGLIILVTLIIDAQKTRYAGRGSPAAAPPKTVVGGADQHTAVS
jgi:hypothetical protein